MDERRRSLERAWNEVADPLVGARLLHERHLMPAELLRDPLFEDAGVRRAYASELPAADPLREFITTQLALDGDDLSADERSRLTVREEELLERHGVEWTGPRATCARFGGCSRSERCRTTFGPVLGEDDRWELLEGRAVQLPRRVLARDLIDRGAAALGPGPVPPVQLEGLYEVTAFEVASHELDPSLPPRRRERLERQLRGVLESRLGHLRSRYGPQELAGSLAGCEALQSVRDLDLWSYNLGDAHTRAVLESPYLTNLRRLEVIAMRQTAAAFEPLARDPRYGSLEELCFKRLDDQDGRSRAGPELAALLASASHLGRLRSLAIPFASLGPQGMLALVRAPALAGLERLDVSENELSDACVEELAREPALAQLRALDLKHSAPARTLGQLLGSPSLHDVEVLGLASGALDDDAGHVPIVPAVIDLPRLRSLDLGFWNFTGAAAHRFADARLPRLRSLSLDFARLDDESFAALVASPLFAAVEELDVYFTDVGDRGLEALAASPWGPRLRRLRLGGAGSVEFTAEGIAALARSQHARTLNVIDFGETFDDGHDDVARALVAAPLERITRIVVSQESARDILRARWGARVAHPYADDPASP